MANPLLTVSPDDHDYTLSGLREACFDGLIQEEEIVQLAKNISDHTPLQSKSQKI